MDTVWKLINSLNLELVNRTKAFLPMNVVQHADLQDYTMLTENINLVIKRSCKRHSRSTPNIKWNNTNAVNNITITLEGNKKEFKVWRRKNNYNMTFLFVLACAFYWPQITRGYNKGQGHTLHKSRLVYIKLSRITWRKSLMIIPLLPKDFQCIDFAKNNNTQ